jgi:hypothetical protein
LVPCLDRLYLEYLVASLVVRIKITKYPLKRTEATAKTDDICDGEVQCTLADFNEEQLITRAVLT